ncbi:Rieske (2Fe-2S) protein [Phenylobacterium sp.]|uniref:Rieske (2Fe-2S) protein n=1 Tax=Phenylobacterium sp. TaxID=1871053 RepID=UPI003561360D
MASSSDNPARPAAGQRLCGLDELSDPGSKGFRFRLDSRLFAGFLVRKGGLVTGYVDSCPHAGWPLGVFDDRYLTKAGDHILCAGHGGLFTLEGAGATTPCIGLSLTPWPVAVRDGAVFTA